MVENFNIALYRPEIPPNTGNIARLCAGAECKLHLIGRLGFKTDDKYLRRAGLDYWDKLEIYQYKNLEEFLSKVDYKRIWAITKFGEKNYSEIRYEIGDYLLFGRETKGFTEEMHEMFSGKRLYIPMSNNNVRSINLSNSVAIVLYEAIRQHGISFTQN